MGGYYSNESVEAIQKQSNGLGMTTTPFAGIGAPALAIPACLLGEPPPRRRQSVEAGAVRATARRLGLEGPASLRPTTRKQEYHVPHSGLAAHPGCEVEQVPQRRAAVAATEMGHQLPLGKAMGDMIPQLPARAANRCQTGSAMTKTSLHKTRELRSGISTAPIAKAMSRLPSRTWVVVSEQRPARCPGIARDTGLANRRGSRRRWRNAGRSRDARPCFPRPRPLS